MKYMKYKVYTETADYRIEKIGTTKVRTDADAILQNYAFGFIKFGEKIVFTKGRRA